jgi:hypothetical protein
MESKCVRCVKMGYISNKLQRLLTVHLTSLRLQTTYTVDRDANSLISGKFVRILMAEAGAHLKILCVTVLETVAETV